MRYRLNSKDERTKRMIEELRACRGEEYVEKMWGHILESYARIAYQAGRILRYTPIELQWVDESAMEAYKQLREEKVENYAVSVTCGMIASHFGEVIIRNIGGKWVYPNKNKVFLWKVLISMGFPFDFITCRLFNHCKIQLGDEQIPVFEIAKLIHLGDDRVKSLFEVYKEIEATGKWSGEHK